MIGLVVGRVCIFTTDLNSLLYISFTRQNQSGLGQHSWLGGAGQGRPAWGGDLLKTRRQRGWL